MSKQTLLRLVHSAHTLGIQLLNPKLVSEIASEEVIQELLAISPSNEILLRGPISNRIIKVDGTTEVDLVNGSVEVDAHTTTSWLPQPTAGEKCRIRIHFYVRSRLSESDLIETK